MATYSDTQLIQIVIKAARRVNRNLCLFDTDDEIVISISTGEITSVDDGTFEDLVLLQAECLLSQRDYTLDLNTDQVGIKVVDGEQSLDNKAKGVARGTFFNSDFSPCALYAKEINIEKLKRTQGYDIW